MPKQPTAAQALFPHLRQGTPPEVEQRRQPSIAEAMYPRPKDRRLSPDELREAWHDHLWALVGIRRKE
jgi:hypothetical protein